MDESEQQKVTVNSPEIKQIVGLMQKTGTDPMEIIHLLKDKITSQSNKAKNLKAKHNEFIIEAHYELDWKEVMKMAGFSQIENIYKKNGFDFKQFEENEAVQVVGKFIDMDNAKSDLELQDILKDVSSQKKWREATMLDLCSINKLLKNGLGSSLVGGSKIVATGDQVGKRKGWYEKYPVIRISKSGHTALETMSAGDKVGGKLKILMIRDK